MLEVQFPLSKPAVIPNPPSEAVIRQPLTVQAYTLLQNARVLLSHGEVKLAITLLRQACSLQSHALIFQELTKASIATENWSEAQRVVRQWCRMESTFDSTYYRAQIEYQLGQDEKSLQSYFEALSYVAEERVELFDIFKNIGNLYVRKGDFESAEEFYNKAYALQNNSDTLFVNYGVLEMQRGDINKAKERFRSAVQINVASDKAWVGLSMVHFEFGDEELGVANLKKALDINPANRTAVLLAHQKMSQKQHESYLIEMMSEYISQVDSDEEVSCLLIQKFCDAGRFELAAIETQRLILWNPEDIRFHNLLQQIESHVSTAHGVFHAVS